MRPSIFGNLILPDENDCVSSDVSSGHALGESANLVSTRMGLCLLRHGVGNEVFVFEDFASFPDNRVGHFMKPHHWEAPH